MDIKANQIPCRAKVTVHQERRYDYDERTRLWVYRQVDEDTVVWNLLTNSGRARLHSFCYGVSARSTGFCFIGLSGDATAPSPSDSELNGELVSNGLSRTLGTVTLPTGSSNQTTIFHTFVHTGVSQQIVQKSALFDSLEDGNMNHEVQFEPRTLFENDTLAISYTILLG